MAKIAWQRVQYRRLAYAIYLVSLPIELREQLRTLLVYNVAIYGQYNTIHEFVTRTMSVSWQSEAIAT